MDIELHSMLNAAGLSPPGSLAQAAHHTWAHMGGGKRDKEREQERKKDGRRFALVDFSMLFTRVSGQIERGGFAFGPLQTVPRELMPVVLTHPKF